MKISLSIFLIEKGTNTKNINTSIPGDVIEMKIEKLRSLPLWQRGCSSNGCGGAADGLAACCPEWPLVTPVTPDT